METQPAMSQMVTRCPKCATAFRITSTQLESAKGAVRCGSCLHIFKAQDYLINKAAAADAPIPPLTSPLTGTTKTPASKPAPAKPAPIKPATQAVETASKPIIDKTKAMEDEEDILISDDMDKVIEKESTYEFDGFMDINLQPKQTVSLFEREIRYDDDEDKPEPTDESWAEELLDDEEDAHHQPAKKAAHPEPARESFIKSRESESAPESESYSAPLFSLISESGDDKEPGFSEEFLRATNPGSTPTPTESESYAAALFNEELENQPVAKRPVKSHKIRAFDSSRAALLMNIMPAPVEFTAKRMRRWYQHRLWPSLAILMGIALLFQIAYFKFDYFSRVEPYRTAYVFACPLLGCKVPTLVDTKKIIATNLIVRNHPNADGALMVDAILINNAPFEQPFPDLLLAFSTLDDKPIAARRFTPKEYLGGELAGRNYIPQSQPVHITLELTDPGPDAVNYHLSIP